MKEDRATEGTQARLCEVTKAHCSDLVNLEKRMHWRKNLHVVPGRNVMELKQLRLKIVVFKKKWNFSNQSPGGKSMALAKKSFNQVLLCKSKQYHLYSSSVSFVIYNMRILAPTSGISVRINRESMGERI